jgi:mono/diheme cytochrome c family protein
MEGMLRRRRLLIALVIVLAVVAAVGVPAYGFFTRDEPATYANPVDHFKYGSIGAEQERGVPYYIWAVLPTVFHDRLPKGEGDGYARFGFIYEPGHDRPIGTSYRKKPIGLVGLNCAACHTSTMRASAGAPRQIVLGMPADGLRLQDYANFLRGAGRDPRFNADTLMAAIERRFPHISWGERFLYRHVVIRETKKALHEIDEDFAWTDRRPPTGAGRVDTFNPWKQHFEILTDADTTVGTADFPSIWDQKERKGLYLHWDGNNNSLSERNLSATLVAGATEDSLDEDSLERLVRWLQTLPAPAFPRNRIDTARAARGEPLYKEHCASCHDLGGARIGQVTPLAQIRTDPERLRSFTPELVPHMNGIGKGREWAFTHYRKTQGYANAPLDGIWARAPYLHNGSVPTLRALLFPDERPEVFWTGYDVYDWKDLGFVSSGPAAERAGFRFDTRVRGNGNGGHTYGSELTPAQREAILEYLKTT